MRSRALLSVASRSLIPSPLLRVSYPGRPQSKS
jgi:hypothetical protein